MSAFEFWTWTSLFLFNLSGRLSIHSQLRFKSFWNPERSIGSSILTTRACQVGEQLEESRSAVMWSTGADDHTFTPGLAVAPARPVEMSCVHLERRNRAAEAKERLPRKTGARTAFMVPVGTQVGLSKDRFVLTRGTTRFATSGVSSAFLAKSSYFSL